MATDLTEVLLRRQADRYNTDRFGQRPDLLSDAGGNWNAGNFVQGVNQGIGNLLGAINAPAAREEAARQEAIAAEQVQYDRDQDALAHELRKAQSARADKAGNLATRKYEDTLKAKLLGEQASARSASEWQKVQALKEQGAKDSEAFIKLISDPRARGALSASGDDVTLAPWNGPAQGGFQTKEEYEDFANKFNLLNRGKQNAAALQDANKGYQKLVLAGMATADKSDDYLSAPEGVFKNNVQAPTEYDVAHLNAQLQGEQQKLDNELTYLVGDRNAQEKQLLDEFSTFQGTKEYDQGVLNPYYSELTNEEASEAKGVAATIKKHLDTAKDSEGNPKYGDLNKQAREYLVRELLRETKGMRDIIPMELWTGQWEDDVVIPRIDSTAARLQKNIQDSSKVKAARTKFENNVNLMNSLFKVKYGSGQGVSK